MPSHVNRLLCFFLLALSVALLESCSNSSGVSQEIVEDSSHEGMVVVLASGQSVALGTNDTDAPAKEKPSMKVSFDYDFSIGKHEVTCSEFNELAKSVQGLGAKESCKSDSIPVTNVTYYDAVLFSNERSKLEGFDTAYSYVALSFDSEGSCTGMDGLVFHPEVLAYRLPTEAEWVYAASLGWKPSDGWHNGNSGYKIHPVCSKSPNEIGACDMSGNVMEWVNDWMGYFRDTAVVDYAGAPDGGLQGERIVKGGSFRNDLSSINLYSRGDVYRVTSSTKANYVGFRLAFGAIPGAVWMGNGGKASNSRIVPLLGASAVRSLTGTYKTKLAFRNDVTGNLAFIDYGSGSLSVVEIEDTLDVYHPDISPNGTKVAFCTGLEGVKGKSELFVRDLNAKGTNLVKLDVESAAIPRWRVLDSGDTVVVYVTDAGNNKDESAWLSMSTWQVPFAKGEFGKPEKLLDGAYHDGVSLEGDFAVTGSSLLRAYVNGQNVVWYNGEQACNASLSKDASKRTLFLDFGGKTGKDFVGETYKTHERLLVVDSLGKLVQSVKAPDGYTFSHSEWAVGADKDGLPDSLVAVSLANANSSYPKLAVVNVARGMVTELVQGEELWHPCLWVKGGNRVDADDNLDADSAGVYMEGDAEDSEIIMKVKMRMFWDMKDTLEAVAIGSSRTERGVDPDYITSYSSFNFGYSGNELWATLYITQNYVLKHVPNLKLLMLELSPDLENLTPEFMNDVLFEQARGYVYDRNHDFWADGVPDNFVAMVDENNPYTSEDSAWYVNSRGVLREKSVGWGKTTEIDQDSVFPASVMADYRTAYDSLCAVIVRCLDSGIKVVVTIFPQSPKYLQTGAFGRHGMRKSLARQSINRLKQMAENYQGFEVFDEYNYGDHDYGDEMALNWDHMSAAGAKRFSQRLDSLLQKMKNEL